MNHDNDNAPAVVANSGAANGQRRRKAMFDPVPVTDNPRPYPDVYNMGECCGKCPEMLAAIEADRNAG